MFDREIAFRLDGNLWFVDTERPITLGAWVIACNLRDGKPCRAWLRGVVADTPKPRRLLRVQAMGAAMPFAAPPRKLADIADVRWLDDDTAVFAIDRVLIVRDEEFFPLA